MPCLCRRNWASRNRSWLFTDTCGSLSDAQPTILRWSAMTSGLMFFLRGRQGSSPFTLDKMMSVRGACGLSRSPDTSKFPGLRIFCRYVLTGQWVPNRTRETIPVAGTEGGEALSTKVLVVELEPTHYKTDLWNAFVDSGKAEVTVVYTERRNWSPDAGHDYQRFPVDHYASVVLEGKGLAGAIRSALKVLAMFRKVGPAVTYIAGYVHLQTVAAILYASVFGKRYVVHADVFNNGMPGGRWRRLKWLVRQALRRLVFARAEAVLVCGRMGIETARAAGCPEHKILDFPYSVSLARILSDQPAAVPPSCLDDLQAAKSVVFFSGRMIPRKGLPTLLEAMAALTMKTDWVLWIEGAGPELQAYTALGDALGLGGRCRFLGFCQYDLHSWLMRSAGIVVVPSFEDSWGIVVDEGLQLGRAVISSDATGSGYDRIEHGVNGFVFSAGDARALAGIITALLDDPDLMTRVGRAAQAEPRNVRPEDNVATLMKLAGRKP